MSIETYHSFDVLEGMVRTGYYAKAKTYSNPVCISRVNKGGFPEIPELAPLSQILSSYKYVNHDEKAYVQSYEEQLDNINWDRICRRCAEMLKQGPITLLCFEKPGDFCHRYAAAERLSRELVKRGILTEDQISSPSERITDEQPSLFD